MVAAAAITATAAGAMTAISPASPVGAAVAPTAGVGTTASWIRARLGVDGLLPAMGYSATDNTAQAAIGLALAGVGETDAERAADALAADVDAYVVVDNGSGPEDHPGRIARLILLSVLLGRDPASFGGVDLPARLAGTRRSTGPDTGLYGPPDIYNSAFNQGLALVALHAIGASDPAAVAWLKGQQCADGSWTAYRADTGVPCAFDPVTFAGPDSNVTAMAAMGLVANSTAATVDPTTWFDSIQNPDGGFPFSAGFSSDPNSTALVVQALLALGVDPEAGVFVAGSPSPFAALESFRLGCSAAAADRGAYWASFDPQNPNALATVQALPAAARATLIVDGPATFGPDPAAECPAPTTTTTAPPTTTTTVAPTTPTLTPEQFVAFVIFVRLAVFQKLVVWAQALKKAGYVQTCRTRHQVTTCTWAKPRSVRRR